jgi:hypothetical protein
MPSPIAYFTEDNAHKLASNIVNFWVAQGYPREAVGVKIVQSESSMDVVVRSNLKNGTPPGKPKPQPRKFVE